MAFSVNTNASALSALLNLNNTTRDLEQTQTRINTGLKISTAKTMPRFSLSPRNCART